VIPAALVGGLAVGVIAIANLLAVAPAVAARNTRPARLLRTT
jgi:hypothetical protein